MHTLTKPKEKNMKYLIVYRFTPPNEESEYPHKWHFHDDCGSSEYEGEKDTQELRDALANMYPHRTYKVIPLLGVENLEKIESPVKGVKT